MRPMCLLSRSPTFVHVSPPSVLLYTPSPHEELCRFARSPVPTQTTEVSRWWSAIAPTEWVPSSSNTGTRVMPLSGVL